jgi:hypothetical protein
MRTVILNHIRGLRLGNYLLSENLPWLDSGEPVYYHNKKYIYVDTAQTSQTALSDALDGRGYVDEITTVSVYFVNDAKVLPVDYDAVVELLKTARLAIGTEGYTSRTCQVSSNYIQDNIETTLVFSFRKLLTN